mgnify:CR=1 FL=1
MIKIKFFLIKYHLINYDKYEESLLIREFKVYKSFIYFKFGEVTANISEIGFTKFSMC